MPSLLFPDSGTRYVILPSGRFAANARGYLYEDEDLTVPAEVYYDAAGAPGTQIMPDNDGRVSIVLDAYGGQVDYWGPASGVKKLWIVVHGVPVAVNADYGRRIDDVEQGVPSDATDAAKGVIALAGVLAGTADAPALASGAVGPAALAPNAVTAAKIAPSAVGAAAVAGGVLTDSHIAAAAAISSAKLTVTAAIADAQPRSVMDRLRERVSIFDVMSPSERADVVSGSPVLDHTSAFNKIIASCVSAGIREYTIPAGVYRVAGTILGGANVYGVGPAAGAPNLASQYSARINHVPASGSVDFYQQAGTYPAYVAAGGFRNVSIQASPSGFSRRCLSYDNFLGADVTHLEIWGAWTDAPICLKGYMNARFHRIRILNTTTTETAAAVRLLSWGGEHYGTTLTLSEFYVSGQLAPGNGGIANVVKADPASGRGIRVERPVLESINGIAFNVGKGNQVVVQSPYVENTPNSNSSIPMFEVGVTGAATPNDAYDTATSLGIYGTGEEQIQYSQGAATLTRLVNADVAQAVDIFNIRLTRCLTLISGTNATQQVRLSNVVSSSVTTVTSGLTPYKVFDLGGNVFASATLSQTVGAGTDATRDGIPASLLSHRAIYASSDVGTEGRMSWYDKVNNRWSSFRTKLGIAPTVRTWTRGDVVDNAYPSIGGPAGWACTATGTGGAATWQIAGQAGVAKGTTASRPTKTTMGLAAGAADTEWAGTMYLDTTLAAAGKPIWWTGAAWVDSTGSVV